MSNVKTVADYERDYHSALTHIRSLLASQRTVSQLSECQSLLITARTAATALQALAEVEGDYVTIQQAQARFDHDLTPLQAEISRGTTTPSRTTKTTLTSNGNTTEQDFFYRNNDLEQQGLLDTEALMQSSHDLLRESQALVSDTEYIGMSTLTQMGQQREQLQIASDHLDGTTDAMQQARLILTSMRDKVWRNKVALQLIAIGLGLMNFLVIVWMWKKHHHK